ncbi:MAG: phosphate signaling complex protein PhoU [Actinomycetes bacterium]
MREQYHEQLDEIRSELVTMTKLVSDAMGRATHALLAADLAAAESVIASDSDIDVLADRIEEEALDLIALQAPVARELRTVVGALRMSATLERMGDLAEHIAQIARNSYPAAAVPDELSGTIREMGDLAVRLVSEDGDIISSLDVEQALRMETEDDRMDDLQRQLMAHLFSPAWTHGVEMAIELAMAVRFYERFADHSVSVARRIVHQATGQRIERIEQA